LPKLREYRLTLGVKVLEALLFDEATALDTEVAETEGALLAAPLDEAGVEEAAGEEEMELEGGATDEDK
jgi:hypothetical protein